ncbi:hypothetical protein NW768_010945 [Fusarium equiseti]|uniref:FAD/NAD(P)-binding domain-containing protein n=1 Tax=Fusarium equiseti TaxID=61235 RepID=A0ABQ8QYY8_FUSEQ|nr:hypothetical protein NW768_010945 [Fusarium equiseti]
MPHAVSSTRGLDPHYLRNALDVLIIGAGAAGLSAALALGRARRSAAIFGSFERSGSQCRDMENLTSLHTHMITELNTKYRTVSFISTAAKSVRERGMVFEVEDITGRCWKGRKVILATGSHEILPKIMGYKELRGTGILDFSQCPELEDTSLKCAAALITSGDFESIDSAIFSAHLARQHTPDVTLLTNGMIHVEQHPQIIAAVKRGFKIDNRLIQSFTKPDAESSVNVEFDDGMKVAYGFIAHKPRSEMTGPFADQLDLEMTSEGRILVEGDYNETSVRGVFAAGSCASVIDSETVELSCGVTAGTGANFQIVEDDVGF